MPKLSQPAGSNSCNSMDLEENNYLRSKNRELAKALADIKLDYGGLLMEKSYLQKQNMSQLLTNRKLMHLIKNVNGDAVEALKMIGKLSEIMIKIMNTTKVDAESTTVDSENESPRQSIVRPMIAGHVIQNPRVNLQRFQFDQMGHTQNHAAEAEETEVLNRDLHVTPAQSNDTIQEDENDNANQNPDELENNDDQNPEEEVQTNLTTVQELDENNLSVSIIVASTSANNTHRSHLSPVIENSSRKRPISPLITRRNKKINLNKSSFNASSLSSSLSNNFGSSELSSRSLTISQNSENVSYTSTATPTKQKNQLTLLNAQFEDTFNPSLQSSSTPYKFESSRITDIPSNITRHMLSNIENCRVLLTRLPLPAQSNTNRIQSRSENQSHINDSNDTTLTENTTIKQNSAGKRKQVKKSTKRMTQNSNVSIELSKETNKDDEPNVSTRPKRTTVPKNLKEASLRIRMRRT